MGEKIDLILCNQCCGSGMQAFLQYIRTWTAVNARPPKCSVLGIFVARDQGVLQKHGIDIDTLQKWAYIIDGDKVERVPNAGLASWQDKVEVK